MIQRDTDRHERAEVEAKYINNQEDPDYVPERGVGYGGSVQDLGSDSDATQPARPVADDRRDTGSDSDTSTE